MTEARAFLDRLSGKRAAMDALHAAVLAEAVASDLADAEIVADAALDAAEEDADCLSDLCGGRDV